MNKKIFASLIILLMLVVMASGCINQDTIKSEDDASDAIGDISTDVEDVSSALEEVTDSLGSAVRPE